MTYEQLKIKAREALLYSPYLSWIHPIIRLFRQNTNLENNASAYSYPGIIPIERYSGESPRLLGSQLDAKTQLFIKTKSPYDTPSLPLTPITVIDKEVYLDWKENNCQFSNENATRLTTVAQEILKKTGRATIRRAIFHKETKEIPLASTFNGKDSPNSFLHSLHELYTEYLKYPESEFVHESFAYPYVDTIPISDPLTCKDDQLPIGGTAFATDEIEDTNGKVTIHIRSGFGDSAAINTGHPEADDVIVHVYKRCEKYPVGNAYIAKRQTHPIKTKMIVQRKPPESWNAKPLTIEDNNQQRSTFYEVDIGDRIVVPTISDQHAIAIALHLANSMWLSESTRKLEFSYGPTYDNEGQITGLHPHILENVPFTAPIKEHGRTILGTGPLMAILNTHEDLSRLKLALKQTSIGHHPTDRPIIALSTQLLEIMRLDRTIRGQLENLGQKVIIVGTLNETEHTARALGSTHTLANIPHGLLKDMIDVETVLFRIGKRYKIVRADGICMLYTPEEESGISLPPYITIPQAIQMGLIDSEKIGGKSYGLARLNENGYPIPENTLTLTTSFFRELIRVNHLDEIFSKLNETDNPLELEKLFEEIRQGLKKIPPHLTGALIGSMRASMDNEEIEPLIAIRSNLSIEDDGEHPMAGTFESALNVPLRHNTVSKALLRVIRNYFAPGVATQIFDQLSGNERKQRLHSILGSVIIQQMLPAEYSGTLFTYDVNATSAKEREYLTLQYSPHIGGVVDGGTGKKIYSIKRDRDGDVIQINIKDEAGDISSPMTPKQFRQLPDDDITLGLPKHIIVNLLRLGKNAAKTLGSQQDMEWGVVRDTKTNKLKIVFLQTRPILTV